MSESLKLLKSNLLKTAHIRQQHELNGETSQRKWNRLLALTLLLGSIVYLVQINMIATKGYAIQELESKMTNIMKENENMRIRMFEAQKLDILQAKAASLGLVRSDHIEYLAPKGSVATVR